MKQESASIRFLYGTAIGRCFLKVLTRPALSKAVGAFLNTRASAPIARRFVKKHALDLSDCEKQTFDSFNDFFHRKRKTPPAQGAPDALRSPCDALLGVWNVSADSTFAIKHAVYRLCELLGDATLANEYEGGTCLIFRLTPQHYHRYAFCATGRVHSPRRIEGVLHCVRPIAYTKIPVFSQNSREFCRIDSPTLGPLLQMEVGALLVGKIVNHPLSDTCVATEEKGYFAFGGSTIVVLCKKDTISLHERFAAALDTAEEVPVTLGEEIGTGR